MSKARSEIEIGHGDQIAGGLTAAFSTLGILLSGAVILYGARLEELLSGLQGGVQKDPAALGSTIESVSKASTVVTFVAIGVGVACLINIVGAVGVFSSRRWGFYTCLAVGSLGVLLSFGGGVLLGSALSAALASYCFLRVSGRYGPIPR
ncbi:hypothetical protein EON79_03820 [bacterium]|nr:MAG: hypothetical protein EON79_03820 [bacterium]